MSARTAFLSKLIGSYCLLIALPMAIHKESTVATVLAMVHDAPVAFLCGLILVPAALAIILTHNIWSGGAVPIIVTLVGWLSLIKGLLFLFLPPPEAVGVFVWGSAWEHYYYVDVALAFLLGFYLAYAGFTSKPADEIRMAVTIE